MEINRPIFLKFLELFEIESLGLSLSILVEHVSHACLVAVAAVAILVEPVLQGLGCTVEVFLWQEVEYLPTGMGVAGGTTGDEHTETALSVLDASLQSEVGDVGVVGTFHARVYRHLILSGHRERVLLGNEAGGKFFHVGIDIKLLIGGQSAAIVHHHVSHRVATATGTGDAYLLQLLQGWDGIGKVYVVYLYLLSGGDV